MDNTIMRMFSMIGKLMDNVKQSINSLLISDKKINKANYLKTMLTNKYIHIQKRASSLSNTISKEDINRSKYKALITGVTKDMVVDIISIGMDIDDNSEFIKKLNNIKETEDNSLGIKFKQVYYIPNVVGNTPSPFSKMNIPLSGLKGSDFSTSYDSYTGTNTNIVHSQFLHNVFSKTSNTLKISNHNLIGHYDDGEFSNSRGINWTNDQDILQDVNKSENENQTKFKPGSVPRMGIEYFDEYNKWRTYVLYDPDTTNNKSQYEFITKLSEWIKTKPDEKSIEYNTLVDYYGNSRYASNNDKNNPKTYDLGTVLPYFNNLLMYNFRSIGSFKTDDILNNNIYKNKDFSPYKFTFIDLTDKLIGLNDTTNNRSNIQYESMADAIGRFNLKDTSKIKELNTSNWQIQTDNKISYKEVKENDTHGNLSALDRFRHMYSDKKYLDNTGKLINYRDMITSANVDLNPDNDWELNIIRMEKEVEHCDLTEPQGSMNNYNCVPNPEPIYKSYDLKKILMNEYGVSENDPRINLYIYPDHKVGSLTDREDYFIEKNNNFYRLSKVISNQYKVMEAYIKSFINNLDITTTDVNSTNFKFVDTKSNFGDTLYNVIKESNVSTIGYFFQLYELEKNNISILLNILIKNNNNLYLYNIKLDSNIIYNLLDYHNPIYDSYSSGSKEFTIDMRVIYNAKIKFNNILSNLLQPLINYDTLDKIETTISNLNSIFGSNETTLYNKTDLNTNLDTLIQIGVSPLHYELKLPEYPFGSLTLPISQLNINNYIELLNDDYGDKLDEYDKTIIGYKPMRVHTVNDSIKLGHVKYVTRTETGWVNKPKLIKYVSDGDSDIIESKESASIRLGIPENKLRINKNYISDSDIIKDMVAYIKGHVNDILKINDYKSTFSSKSETGEATIIISKYEGVNRLFVIDVNNIFNKTSGLYHTLATIMYVDDSNNRNILNLYLNTPVDNPIITKKTLSNYIDHNRNTDYDELMVNALNTLLPSVDISHNLNKDMFNLNDLIDIKIPIIMVDDDGSYLSNKIIMEVNISSALSKSKRMVWEQYEDKRTRDENVYEFITRFNDSINAYDSNGLEAYSDYMNRVTNNNYGGGIERYESLKEFISRNSTLNLYTGSKVIEKGDYEIAILASTTGSINSIIIKHKNNSSANVYYYDVIVNIDPVIKDLESIDFTNMNTIIIDSNSVDYHRINLLVDDMKLFSDDKFNTGIKALYIYNTLSEDSNIIQEDGKWILVQNRVSWKKAYNDDLEKSELTNYQRVTLDDVKELIISNSYKYVDDVLLTNLPQDVSDILLNTSVLDLYPTKSKQLETLNGLSNVINNTPFIVVSNPVLDSINPIRILDVNYELNTDLNDNIVKWRSDITTKFKTSLPITRLVSKEFSLGENSNGFTTISTKPYTDKNITSKNTISKFAGSNKVFGNDNKISDITIPYDVKSISDSYRKIEYFYETMFNNDDEILLNIVNNGNTNLLRCWYLPHMTDFENMNNPKNMFNGGNLSKVYIDKNDDCYINLLLIHNNDLLTPPSVFEHKFDRYVKSNLTWFRDNNVMDTYYLGYDKSRVLDDKLNTFDKIKYNNGNIYLESNLINDVFIDDTKMDDYIELVKPVYMEIKDNNIINIPNPNDNRDLIDFCINLTNIDSIIDIESDVIPIHSTNINSLNTIFSHTKRNDFSYFKSGLHEEGNGELDKFNSLIKPLEAPNKNEVLNSSDIDVEVKVFNKLNLNNSLYDNKIINDIDLNSKERLINVVAKALKLNNDNYISNYIASPYNSLIQNGIFLDYSKKDKSIDTYQYLRISANRFEEFTKSKFTYNTYNTMSMELYKINNNILFHPSNLDLISVYGTITPVNNNNKSMSDSDDKMYGTFSFGLNYYNKSQVVNDPWTRAFIGLYTYNKGGDNLEKMNTTIKFPLLKIYDTPSKHSKNLRLINDFFIKTKSPKYLMYDSNETNATMESVVNYDYDSSLQYSSESVREFKTVLCLNSNVNPEFKFFEKIGNSLPIWIDVDNDNTGLFELVDIDYISTYNKVLLHKDTIKRIKDLISDTVSGELTKILDGNEVCISSFPFTFNDNKLEYDKGTAVKIVNKIIRYISTHSILTPFNSIYIDLLNRVLNDTIVSDDILLMSAQIVELKYFANRMTNHSYKFRTCDIGNRFIINIFDNLVQIIDNDIYEFSIFNDVYIPIEYIYSHRGNWSELKTIKNKKNKVQRHYLNYSYITYEDINYPNLGYDSIYNCRLNERFINYIYNE